MTDPLEDRLRHHFADRAGEVNARPDPTVLVERSTGRGRVGAALVTGLVAIAVVLAGGSFLTGMSVAGSSRAPAVRAHGPSAAKVGGPMASPGPIARTGESVPSGAPPLTVLFSRITLSGVTVRAYAAIGPLDGGCTQGTPCPPVGIVPGPTPCPNGAMCVQPATRPNAGSAGHSIPEGSSTSSTWSGTPSTGTASTGNATVGPGQAGTVLPGVIGCRTLTLELSNAQAVSTASITAPADGVPAAGSSRLLDSGSFGGSEGGPVGWIAVAVGSGVDSVHLVSSTGVVLDSMAPVSGVVVLVATGSNALTGTTAVGLDVGGGTVTTVPADLNAGSPEPPGCAVVPTGPPATTSTTVPEASPATTSAPSNSTVVTPMESPPVATQGYVGSPTGSRKVETAGRVHPRT
jgi:hypothetical protein